MTEIYHGVLQAQKDFLIFGALGYNWIFEAGQRHRVQIHVQNEHINCDILFAFGSGLYHVKRRLPPLPHTLYLLG